MIELRSAARWPRSRRADGPRARSLDRIDHCLSRDRLWRWIVSCFHSTFSIRLISLCCSIDYPLFIVARSIISAASINYLIKWIILYYIIYICVVAYTYLYKFFKNLLEICNNIKVCVFLERMIFFTLSLSNRNSKYKMLNNSPDIVSIWNLAQRKSRETYLMINLS